MRPVLINLRRFLLRDFEEADRGAFVSYQMDPRYLRLYDFDPGDVQRSETLFDLFLAWQREEPRLNVQLGIFDRKDARLCGSAGVRKLDERVAILGIELAPSEWGRYRLALEVVSALLEYGFGTLGLETIVGESSSGNTRVEKLARWFGAEIVGRRAGPVWMQARGWQEVDWALRRADWEKAGRRAARASE
jgi:[ribosomal protein S5]-alanine N-acetyltransferase